MSVNWIDVAVAAFSAWGVLRLDIMYRRWRGRRSLGVRKAHVEAANPKRKHTVTSYVSNAAFAQECHKCHENVIDYAVLSNNEVRCLKGCSDV